MIEVGQLVTGRPDATRYGVTTNKALCLVEKIDADYIYVLVVAHADGRVCHDWVNEKYFIPCTYAEFMEKYPDAKLMSTYSAEELNKIKNVEEMKMELAMNKEKIGSYRLIWRGLSPRRFDLIKF